MIPVDLITADMQERAARGALVLDADQPGWARKIARPIQVDDPDSCPIGQTYRGEYGTLFSEASQRLAADSPSPSHWKDQHGFIPPTLQYEGYGASVLRSEEVEAHDLALRLLDGFWEFEVARRTRGIM
jgi:hypothetical protein